MKSGWASAMFGTPAQPIPTARFCSARRLTFPLNSSVTVSRTSIIPSGTAHSRAFWLPRCSAQRAASMFPIFSLSHQSRATRSIRTSHSSTTPLRPSLANSGKKPSKKPRVKLPKPSRLSPFRWPLARQPHLISALRGPTPNSGGQTPQRSTNSARRFSLTARPSTLRKQPSASVNGKLVARSSRSMAFLGTCGPTSAHREAHPRNGSIATGAAICAPIGSPPLGKPHTPVVGLTRNRPPHSISLTVAASWCGATAHLTAK